MMMLINLVKKDLILVKSYLLFTFASMVFFPVFLSIKTNFPIDFLGFCLTALFIVYALFNTVSMAEHKYKGSTLLCATPYTRSALVKAKYLFILAIFICCYIIYTVTALLVPIDMTLLNTSTLGISLLIAAVYFGIIIPIQYQFGYEKTKYISFFFIFITPFVFPYILKLIQTSNIIPEVTLPFPQIIQDLIPSILALASGLVSMYISIHIYSRKSL